MLGLEEGEVPAGSDVQWEFSGLPEGGTLFFACVLAVLCIALIVLLYRSETALRPAQKVLLSALRLAALAIVILILLNPRLFTEIQLERKGKTLLFFDVSATMGESDTFDGEELDRVAYATDLEMETEPTRSEIARAALERAQLLERLAESNTVELYTFDTSVRKVDSISEPETILPRGEGTHLGAPLEAILGDTDRHPIAASIVVSDGRNTGGAVARDLARQCAAQKGAPVHTIAVGRTQLPRNYAILDFAGPKAVEIDYPVELEGKVVLSGIQGPATLVLERETRDGRSKREIDRKTITPRNLHHEGRHRFVDIIERKGDYRYTLRIEEHPDEIRTRDNRRFVFVRAAEQEYRLLLLAGSSTPEFRYLRNFTIRDDSIVVSTWQWQADQRFFQDGDVTIRSIPDSAEELEEFDAVVLIDPDPEMMTPAFQRALSEFVLEQGGGLGFVAGEAQTPLLATLPQCEPLRKLLPVHLDGGRSEFASERSTVSGVDVYAEAWRPELTAAGLAHPAFRLRDDSAQSEAIWGALPEFYFAHTCGSLRPAGVALATADSRVVAAQQQVGLGQSLYLGTDEFWRWRAAGVGYHERFWSSTIRYLSMGKKFAGSQKVSIETDREVYHDGETARITVQLSGSTAAPPRLDLAVRRIHSGDEPEEAARPGGESGDESASDSSTDDDSEDAQEWIVSVHAEPDRPGRFAGVFRPPHSGGYEVRLDDRGSVTFKVRALSSEWDDPSPDPGLLAEIAAESGGLAVPLDQIAALSEQIPPVSHREILGRRSSSAWDSAAWMILFAILLALEWTFRKLWRLN